MQMRTESYNREIRERHMKTFRKRQEKKEIMKKQKAKEKATQDADYALNDDSDSNRDMYEVIQLKKVNQKFDRLMAFDIEKQFSKTQHLLGKQPNQQSIANNLSAADNMRLN